MMATRLSGPSLRFVLCAAAVVAAAGLAVSLGSLAEADTIDPQSPTVIVVGVPPGYAPSDRLGPSRQGKTPLSLPAKPQQLWRSDLAGGLDFPPLVDAQGSIIAALVSPDVVKLGADRRERWRVRLGSSAAVVAPVLTSDGSTVVLGAGGKLWSISSAGGRRFAVDLQTRTKRAQATPLALDDGSVVIAAERELLHVAGDGTVRARAELPDRPVGGVIAWQQGYLVTMPDGEVHFWQPPQAARRLGSFNGQLEGGAVLLGPRTLAGVLSSREVVALDLRSGSTRQLAGGPGTLQQLEGPVTHDPAGLLWATSVAGELMGIDAHGVQVRHLALENAMLIFGTDGGAPVPAIFQRLELRPSPPLVVDRHGRIGFFRASGRVGVIDEQGNMQIANERFCSRPLAILPAGESRLLVACQSGALGLFGEATEQAKK